MAQTLARISSVFCLLPSAFCYIYQHPTLRHATRTDSQLEIDDLEFDTILRGAELKLKVSTTFITEELSVSFEIWENQRFINRKSRSTAVLPTNTVTPQ